MGDSITEGTIAAVEKGVGDSVSVDEIVAIIDTDKVSVEVRADAAGVIEEIFVAEDENVEVGAKLLKIATNGVAVPAAAAPAAAAMEAHAPAAGAVEAPPAMEAHGRTPMIKFLGKRSVPGGGIPVAAAAPKAAAPAAAKGAMAAHAATPVVPSGLAVDFSEVGPFYGRPEITESEMLALESGGGTEVDGW